MDLQCFVVTLSSVRLSTSFSADINTHFLSLTDTIPIPICFVSGLDNHIYSGFNNSAKEPHETDRYT